MSAKLTDKVSFGFIRYANCWEDADILLEGLSPKPGDKILSIASAGDNSFSLLLNDPQLVVAVDVNKIQLYLVELKRSCIKNFDREQTLQFLGFRECATRIEMFNSIKPGLSAEALQYWELRSESIKKGIILDGKFERYFITFSRRIMPWIHSRKTTEELLRTKPEPEQQRYYTSKWNSWRWKMLFRIFFSKYVMGKYGRDPEFLKEVKVSVPDYIFKKAGKHLRSKAAQENFILRFNLTGNFGNLLPHYLLPGNYEKIKSNLSRLVIKEGYAEDAIREHGKFDRMNLSNIFEYMNKDLFIKTANDLLNGLNDKGRMAYWNLMVPRRISGLLPERAQYLKELSLELSERDKGFFYNQFIVDEKIA